MCQNFSCDDVIVTFRHLNFELRWKINLNIFSSYPVFEVAKRLFHEIGNWWCFIHTYKHKKDWDVVTSSLVYNYHTVIKDFDLRLKSSLQLREIYRQTHKLFHNLNLSLIEFINPPEYMQE